jgi:hypothetical protein
MRTVVLIHGFHLASSLALPAGRVLDWRDLALGSGTEEVPDGRATYGVYLAYRERADAVIFSTGASEKDGLKEAEYTYREVQEKIDAIAAPLRIIGLDLIDWLRLRVQLDTESRTTAEELDRNLAWSWNNGYDRVILVTSRFHAPRALASANDARKRLGLHGLIILAAAPEDDSPTPTIFEPATRPDRPSVDWHGTLKRIFALPPERQAEAFRQIERILALTAP